jgi:alpha-L-rhamnosidase
MKPSFVEDLNFVNASFQSMYGEIRSHWKRNGTDLVWNVSIPANTKAELYIPASSADEVKEKAAAGRGIRFVKMEGDRAVFEISSGDFTFNTTIRKKA